MRDMFRQKKEQHIVPALLDTRGTSAIEFAIVGPVFLAMVIGGFYMCIMLFSLGSLQLASEAAARCWAVNSTTCSTGTSAQTYATNNYYGSGAPTFTASNQTCGYQVVGTLTYSFAFYYRTLDVPLSATACFP